jgi:general secretion pathway protein H
MSEAGNRQTGFTLLETLVVIGIAAMIGALVAPNMERALDVLALQQTTRLLQADLRVARGTALRTGQKVDLEASNRGREYDWIGGSRFMPAGVTLTMSKPLVVYPDGSVSTASIALSNVARKYTLSVDPVTGGVTVSGQ